MSIRIQAFSRFILLSGLATWLSIAVFNNLTDSETNRLLLGQTLSMELLKKEAILGSGLIWRACSAEWSSNLLYAIAAFQLLIAALLWRSAAGYMHATLRNNAQTMTEASSQATLALTCFLMLWLGFICGGLWFGYWLKQGAIQSIHMTLIIITLASLQYVQINPAMSK